MRGPLARVQLGPEQVADLQAEGAFCCVARLPHPGQGAKFTHQGFRPLFNSFLVLCVREKHEPGSRSGGRLQGHMGLFPARR